ncbi:hypothetical protein DFH08DRAFT_771393 [Mycena albidolilacea]|uniref:Uncharacterized protein n=1 Tax=Mycena albidolilacea TaxID=1033008 RepID=A0AAD7AF92_9AGAR|nr:hypothetical protein DFH08DRAFT_771393 [Mycena albidolilacea]
MANEDTHTSSLPELTPKPVVDAPETPAVAPVSIPLAEPNPIAPLRSTLVPLGSQAPQPPPQTKRFSAVNINKKFLEKNSSSSSTSAPASNSSANKSGSSACASNYLVYLLTASPIVFFPKARPQTQAAPSHSRLVTTKLTAAPQSLSAPGSGWSRPSSATPPATTVATNGATPTPGEPSSSSGPQSSVTQPPPRPMPGRGPGPRENAPSGGGGKPVWGKAAAKAQQHPDMSSQSDFPTAAEVAAAPRKTKPTQADRNAALKEATAQELASAAANKQARAEEADTFRGVHLDPNAHHWDEMDADDDNFLDGVIEFGDGRQYKIESADLPDPPLAAAESSSSVPSRSGSRLDREETQQLNVPVSKEERFADDFDRSWPRSRASPSVSTRDLPGGPALSNQSTNAAPSPVSPTVSMASDSASRALLFNERSNKLEPYNRAAGGAAGPGQKRGDSAFPAVSPTDTRQFNSGQPQLLQNRGRGFSGAGGGAFGGERGQQQQQQGRPGPPPNAPPNPWTQRKESDAPERGRRLSAMGPPPVPPQAGLAGAGGRQRPPHLPLMSETDDGVPVRPQRRPSTSRESRHPQIPAAEPSSSESVTRRGPSQSPALSHASAVAQSPVIPVSVPLGPQVDLDEVRKDVMLTSAARAKARRQQEEEEREKEKERARRKAAEIEERINAAEAEKAAKIKAKEAEEAAQAQDVLDIIESAVKSVEAKQPEAGAPIKPAPATGVPYEQPKPPPRRPSLMGPPSYSQAPPVDSRPVPPRRLSSTPHQPPPRPPIPTFVAPPSALEQVESLAENAEERDELEVVDFSDLAKFIGVTEEEEPEPAPEPEETPIPIAPAVRPPRPSAADFFDDRPPRSPEVEKTNVSTWRRQSIAQDSEPLTHAQTIENRPRSDVPLDASNAVPTKDASLAAPSAPAGPVPASSPHANRTARNQPFYKEATMSTLDDVMSRIKGAIDGMQSSEREHRSPEVSAAQAVVRPSSLFHPSPVANLTGPKERWAIPAFRMRHQFDAEPQEVMITGCEPPRSPKPAWNTFAVRLPKISQPLEPVNRKQLALYARPAHPRWDVLSFDPPVEGMSRKEFTVNEILFRRTAFKGKSKYKVLLPSSRMTAGPRVNIPMSPRVNAVGAFGRPPAPADALSTWRKQPLASASKNFDMLESETGLSTMSRSPPPELPSDPNVASIPRADVLSSSKSEDVFGSSRSRQPKMPAGSAVAFYRDSKVDAVEPDVKPVVNFFVSSELEDASRQSSENNTPGKPKPTIMVSSPGSLVQGDPLNSASKPFTPRVNGLKPSPTSSPEIGMPSLMSNSKAESKSSDDSTDRTPITPPSHHTASWARSSLNISVKDSPLRGPDPEHLKAVWSQTSNKAGLHAVNSLEGIADDLTAIPFTLQEVKSEDGGTPPPTTTIASSRMSLHDVTRAFQQVPSSSGSSLRPPISPPSTTSPVARPNPAPTPAAYSYSLPPPPNQMMRPNYAPYSPMMSTPSTPMMYPMAPSPVPGRMAVNGMPVNGHTPLYGQPMWMAPQNPMNGSMMRPMGSPYPQLMPYPSPAGSPMYAPQPPQPMQNAPQQPNGPRGRSMPSVMSPVMPHQNAMYTGSPILMHAPPMPVGYMNMPPGGRGQPGNHNGHPPMPPQQQHQPQQHPQHQPNGHPMQHTTGYNPVPSTSFVRPTW